jgi:hypothetical protein
VDQAKIAVLLSRLGSAPCLEELGDNALVLLEELKTVHGEENKSGRADSSRRWLGGDQARPDPRRRNIADVSLTLSSAAPFPSLGERGAGDGHHELHKNAQRCRILRRCPDVVQSDGRTDRANRIR